MTKTLIRYPVRDWIITFSYAQHLEFAAAHPERKYNAGVDFYSDDRNIYACDKGTVRKVGYDPDGYGHDIMLSHSWGFSLYAHLALAPLLTAGMEVEAGTVIGKMGTTGFSTGVHLHFEVRDLNNVVFDPAELLPLSEEAPQDEIAREMFSKGDTAVVVAAYGANFRWQPSYASEDVISCELLGSELTIDGDAVDYGGVPWRPVSKVVHGYMAEYDISGTKLIEKQTAE